MRDTTNPPVSAPIRVAAVVLHACVVLVGSPLAAQEQARDTARVAPVVVSATRVPISQSALPVAVTIITADDLRARGITTVADALADVSSASIVQSGSAGATTSLFLRGGESKYVKVLIDGVPANDPGGSYDFASLTTDNVERIEIVRGPASVIHGADAVTGVVHVITRRGSGPARTEIHLRSGVANRERQAPGAAQSGSMRTLDASAGLSGALTSGSYSVSVARHQSTGLYELNNHYQNNVLSGRFQFAPNEGTELRLSLRYNDYQFNYPTNGGGDVRDRNVYRTEDRTIIGVEPSGDYPVAAYGVTLSSSVNDGGTTTPSTFRSNSFVSHDKTRRRGAELRSPCSAREHRGRVGAQMETAGQPRAVPVVFGLRFPSTRSRGPRAQRRRIRGGRRVADEPVTATAGARVDRHQQFGTFGTGRGPASRGERFPRHACARPPHRVPEPTFFETTRRDSWSGIPTSSPSAPRPGTPESNRISSPGARRSRSPASRSVSST